MTTEHANRHPAGCTIRVERDGTEWHARIYYGEIKHAESKPYRTCRDAVKEAEAFRRDTNANLKREGLPAEWFIAAIEVRP